MRSHPRDDFSRLALLIEKRELTDDLVHTGLVHADRSSHVVPAQAIAQRPGLHLAVTVDVAVRDLVVQFAQPSHARGLHVAVYMWHWLLRPESRVVKR